MAAKRKDLTGMKVGRLTVLYYSHSNRYAYWRCHCECGQETIVRSSHLIAGLVKSCGCVNSETGRQTIKFAQNTRRTHDESRSRLHIIWTNMKQRCGNKNNVGYKDYGGRGIKICHEWENDYISFRDWALSNGYADNLSIDRINNDGNYEPSNCRWASKEIQSNNQRRNVFLTYNNETKTITQWAKEFGISRTTFFRWLNQGKTIEEIADKRKSGRRL
ncbi:MAG: hypothetical protein LBH43_00460 [Treponema sp.]|jgi:hypothetical protein|nr:hypothetical protein [Treponema sp.]